MKVRGRVEQNSGSAITLGIIEWPDRPNAPQGGAISISGLTAEDAANIARGTIMEIKLTPVDAETGVKITRELARRREIAAAPIGGQPDNQAALAQDSSAGDVIAAKERRLTRLERDPLEEERVREGRPLRDSEMRAREEARVHQQRQLDQRAADLKGEAQGPIETRQGAGVRQGVQVTGTNMESTGVSQVKSVVEPTRETLEAAAEKKRAQEEAGKRDTRPR